MKIVAGVCHAVNADAVFVSLRPPGKPLAGLWEFPGGKINPCETPEQALRREWQEELGYSCVVGMSIYHAKLSGSSDAKSEKLVSEPIVDIQFFAVQSDIPFDLGINPRGAEGQQIRWVPLSELSQYPMPATNKTLVQLLTAQT